jgi:hypothetical protein
VQFAIVIFALGFVLWSESAAAQGMQNCPSNFFLGKGVATAEKTVPGSDIRTVNFGSLVTLMKAEASQRARVAANRAARIRFRCQQNGEARCIPTIPLKYSASSAQATADTRGGEMGGITVYGFADWNVQASCRQVPAAMLR